MAVGACGTVVLSVTDRRPSNGQGVRKNVLESTGGDTDEHRTKPDSGTRDPKRGNDRAEPQGKSSVSGKGQVHKSSGTPDMNRIPKEEAIRLARDACKGHMNVPEDCPVKVDSEGGNYVITFVLVLSRPMPAASYYAKVWIDASSGEVKKLLVGS